MLMKNLYIFILMQRMYVFPLYFDENFDLSILKRGLKLLFAAVGLICLQFPLRLVCLRAMFRVDTL